MKTIGKVYKVTDLVSGESSNGQPWEKQTVVVEEQTTGQPRYLAVEFMGEKRTAKTKTLQKGDYVVAEYAIVCNKFTNQNTGVTSWFTKLDGWRIDRLTAEGAEEQR